MKKGIVFKLFLLTTALCTLILAIMIVGQTLFFKQFYAHQKMDRIQTNIQSFEEEVVRAGHDAKAIQKLKRNFYEENATWITLLDDLGNINYAHDFSLEIQIDSDQNNIFSDRLIHIPLYSLVDFEDSDRMRILL